MKVSLLDQTPSFPGLAAEYRRLPYSFADQSDFVEKISERRLPAPAYVTSLRDLCFNSLFGYRIFPESILSFLGEWELEGRKMRTGDVIVQQVLLPPIRTISC